MGRKNRFPKPDVTRIDLSDGDWIEVVKDLNTGQAKKLEIAGQGPPVKVDNKVVFPIDWGLYDLERAMIFVQAWSFETETAEGIKPVPLSLDSMKAIEPESFQEINGAIMRHVLDRAKEKNLLRLEKQKATTPPPQESEPVAEPT